MTIPGDVTAADEHLTGLATELTIAEDSDPGRLAAAAWSLLSELSEATYARIDGERTLALAIQAAQVSVIEARTGSRDPVAPLRRFLSARGRMPPPDATTLSTLAWLGEPGRRGGHQARHQAAR